MFLYFFEEEILRNVNFEKKSPPGTIPVLTLGIPVSCYPLPVFAGRAFAALPRETEGISPAGKFAGHNFTSQNQGLFGLGPL